MPPGEHAWEPDSPNLVVVVNGREFVDLVREVELPFARAEGHPDIAGAYTWLPARLVLPPAGHFLGEPVDPYGDGAKASLLECACGVPGCWPLLARIEVGGWTVAWRDFEQPHRSADRGRAPSWRYDALSFTFARAAYETELRRVADEL